MYRTKLENNSENDNLPQIFDFEGNQIRVIIDQQGEPWFVANDVAEVLGYNRTNHATRMLDEDEKEAHIVGTLGGAQKLAIVNESGLYSLIFGSRKNEAKKFKKWVTSDVLPTIRKTGSYGQQVDLNDTKLLHKLLLNYTDRVIQLEGKLTNDQPKVDFYDDFINSEGFYNLQNAARALNLHPNLFISSLKNHYLFYQGNALVPYRKYMDQGLFAVKSNVIENKARYQTYITPKGLRYFAEHTHAMQTNNDNEYYQSTIINNQFLGE
jgi:prophage antirepressor-like protein